MSTIHLSFPVTPGVCADVSCEAQATDTCYVDGVPFCRLCKPHAEQWRAVQRSLNRTSNVKHS